MALSIYVEDIDAEKPVLSIPLLFCDVARVKYACNEFMHATNVVALGPRQEELRTSTAQMTSDHNLVDAMNVTDTLWLLCVGGRSDLFVFQALFELGIRGAIRWDLPACFRLGDKVLGQGHFGKVYLGYPPEANSELRFEALSKKDGVGSTIMQKPIAIKVFKTAQNDTDEKAIMNEVGCLALARDHPNILRMVSVFCSAEESKETSYAIVTQLCTGDLFAFLSPAPVSCRQACAIMACLFSALAHLHHLGIVHRDVKLGNVLMHGSRALLADFGIATSLGDAKELIRQVGTPGYAAPELVKGRKNITQKIDIFGAGVILYFALYNLLPFDHEHALEMLRLTIRCRVHYPPRRDLPAELLTLLQALLSQRPDGRPEAYRACSVLWKIVPTSQVVSEAYHALPQISKQSRETVKSGVSQALGSSQGGSASSRNFGSHSPSPGEGTENQSLSKVTPPVLSPIEGEKARELSAEEKSAKTGLAAAEEGQEESSDKSPSSEGSKRQLAVSAEPARNARGFRRFLPSINASLLWNPFRADNYTESAQRSEFDDVGAPQASANDRHFVPRPPAGRPRSGRPRLAEGQS